MLIKQDHFVIRVPSPCPNTTYLPFKATECAAKYFHQEPTCKTQVSKKMRGVPYPQFIASPHEPPSRPSSSPTSVLVVDVPVAFCGPVPGLVDQVLYEFVDLGDDGKEYM